ncbi:MAG: AbiV family abortive infection protein [Methylococcales bacterium]
MALTLPKFDRAQLNMLVRGAEKIFENAESLYREAEILAKTGAMARALFLHQISLEECSKIGNISTWAISLLAGYHVNQNKVLEAFGRHSSKNKTNAYMLERSPAEKDAEEHHDLKAALKEFKKLQEQFHYKSNSAKNASLYVDWKDGEFIAPREQISLEMLNEIIVRNETFLGDANHNLRMLKGLEKAPDEMQGMVVEFIEMAEKMRAQNPEDPKGAINALINRFLDIELKKKKS